MPRCRSCGAPIFFLSERPEYKMVGTYNNPKEIRAEPRPMPIDVDPDPRGNIAIYEFPSPTCVWGRDFVGERPRYFARLYHFALKSYVALGGVVYRLHFDSCPARNR